MERTISISDGSSNSGMVRRAREQLLGKPQERRQDREDFRRLHLVVGMRSDVAHLAHVEPGSRIVEQTFLSGCADQRSKVHVFHLLCAIGRLLQVAFQQLHAEAVRILEGLDGRGTEGKRDCRIALREVRVRKPDVGLKLEKGFGERLEYDHGNERTITDYGMLWKIKTPSCAGRFFPFFSKLEEVRLTTIGNRFCDGPLPLVHTNPG